MHLGGSLRAMLDYSECCRKEFENGRISIGVQKHPIDPQLFRQKHVQIRVALWHREVTEKPTRNRVHDVATRRDNSHTFIKKCPREITPNQVNVKSSLKKEKNFLTVGRCWVDFQTRR